MKKEHWLYIIIAILAIWIIASYASAPKSEAPTDTDNSTSDVNNIDTTITPIPAPAPSPVGSTGNTDNSVMVVNQPSGSMVTVGRIAMSFDGWVVVNEDRAGVPGNILGAQRYDAGVYPSGQIELARGTVAGGKYYVMLRTDDGDRMFDYKLDTLYMQGDVPVMATFIAQ